MTVGSYPSSSSPLPADFSAVVQCTAVALYRKAQAHCNIVRSARARVVFVPIESTARFSIENCELERITRSEQSGPRLGCAGVGRVVCSLLMIELSVSSGWRWLQRCAGSGGAAVAVSAGEIARGAACVNPRQCRAHLLECHAGAAGCTQCSWRQGVGSAALGSSVIWAVFGVLAQAADAQALAHTFQ